MVDIRRTKGRQLERKREVAVMGLSGLLWEYQDSRPTIFGYGHHRYNAANQTMEAPGRRADDLSWGKFQSKLPFAEAEIFWLGVPITCAGTVRDGEVDLKQGTTEAIITTDCTYSFEYVFMNDNHTGLAKSMQRCQPPSYLKGVGRQPRSCDRKIIYLTWDDGPQWRMPTRVRYEIYYPVAWMTWAKSEYEVSSWINPDLDYRFFELELTWDVGPEAWKDYLSKRE